MRNVYTLRSAPYKKHPIENQALSAVFIAQASSHIRVSGGIAWLIWRDKGFYSRFEGEGR
jgi:hypothetical protein